MIEELMRVLHAHARQRARRLSRGKAVVTAKENVCTLPSGMRLRVIGNNLIVRMNDMPTKTPGGLVIPDTALGDAHATGEVLALGHLTTNRAEARASIPGLKVGDHVLFVRYLDKTDSNPQLKRLLEDNVLRIRPADVLLVLDREDVGRVR